MAEGAAEAIAALPSVPLPPEVKDGPVVVSEPRELAWAKHESSSSLAFAREMDARIVARLAQASGEEATTVRAELLSAGASLDEALREAEAKWIDAHIAFEPNKKDPTKSNARCSFSW